MATGKHTKTGGKRRRERDVRAPAGRRQYDPKRAVDGESANRYGGYGQSGYDEDEAEKPGVQADFDEEENREADAHGDEEREGKISRKGAKAPRGNAKKKGNEKKDSEH